MKPIVTLFRLVARPVLAASCLAVCYANAAEPAARPNVSRAGTNFISTPVYSPEEDQQVLKAFDGLRVADVCDGMDAVGLHNRGLVDADIRPLWRDTSNYSHRFIGIAVTARY